MALWWVLDKIRGSLALAVKHPTRNDTTIKTALCLYPFRILCSLLFLLLSQPAEKDIREIRTDMFDLGFD